MIKLLHKQVTEHYFRNILIISTLFYFLVGLFYYHQNQLMLYGDAKARLLIAKGTIDSLTPGLAQFGGVWPPLPQLFYLLTIWNDSFFYSGLSGMIISLFGAILTTYFLAKLVFSITKNKIITIISLAAIALNPSFLYMTVIPMSEVLFLSFIIMSTYFFYQWVQQKNEYYLPLAAAGAMLATLTRYEGVLLPILSVLLLIIYSRRNGKDFREIKGIILFYATPAFIGIMSWLVYNQLIFGNFLHFVSGETLTYSRAGGALSGTLTRYNLLTSLSSYFGASILIAGIISCILFVIAIELMLYTGAKKYIAPSVLLISPVIFSIISLFFGGSDIFTFYNSTYLYNIRLGLFILPFIVICYAFLLSIKRFKYIIIVVLAIQIMLLYFSSPATLQEAVDSALASRNISQVKAASWLRNHPINGRVLISYITNQTVVYDAKIPLHTIISENSGIYWKNALMSPNYQVKRIIASPIEGDAIWKAEKNNNHFLDGFTLRYSNKYYKIYDLKNKTQS